MRPTAFQIVREHAYARRNSESHGHFAPTTHRMPAYSFEATPYRWVMREEARKYADEWGIGYDEALEARADELMNWQHPTTWVQDHRNQLALLDSFFSGIEHGRSLVFVYAKDLPLIEERPPGFRALIGAGFVESVGAVQEWEYDGALGPCGRSSGSEPSATRSGRTSPMASCCRTTRCSLTRRSKVRTSCRLSPTRPASTSMSSHTSQSALVTTARSRPYSSFRGSLICSRASQMVRGSRSRPGFPIASPMRGLCGARIPASAQR